MTDFKQRGHIFNQTIIPKGHAGKKMFVLKQIL